MAKAPDWYRSPRWDLDAQADFEARLRRARPQSRPQYIWLKACAVEPERPEIAELLLERVLREYPEDFHAAASEERLGDLLLRRGQVANAERAYKNVLAKGGGISPSATSGAVNISLAELLLDVPGREREVLEQLDLLKPPSSPLKLNYHQFRWERVLAVVSARLGETETSQKAASRALALVTAPDQFARHKGVGRVVASDAVLRELERLAGSQSK